jgi:surfactin synthase thioesterase subunit
MILLCLPYAGGSQIIYYKWNKLLDPSLSLYPIELKGRGRRFNETFYENFEEAIDDIFNIIKNEISNNRYAIYGHSMGSLLAYELYYKIVEAGYNKPDHLFLSGYHAPNIIRNEDHIYGLSDDEFLKRIMEFGGTPIEIANDEELLHIFVPIIRNDFRILENYNYKKRKTKISCDVTIINGRKDSISIGDILAWKEHVCKGFKVYNLDGDHFFINCNAENITNIINLTLTGKPYKREIDYGV